MSQVAFNHDSTRLIVKRQTGTVSLWDVTSGETIQSDLGAEVQADCFVVSPDAKRVLVGFPEKGARVFDAATGKAISPVLEIPLKDDAQPRGVFSPDGELVVIFEEKEVSAFKTSSGERVAKVTLASPTPDDESTLSPQAVFTADGKTCFLMEMSGTVTRYDAGTWKPVGKPMKHPAAESAYIFGFAASADGQWVATYDTPGENGPKGQLQAWDAVKNKALGKPVIAVNGIDGEFVADRLLVRPGRGQASVRSLPAMKSLYSIMVHDDVEGPSVIATPDLKWLLSWGSDRSMRLMDAATGKVATATAFSSHLSQVLPLPDSSGFMAVCDSTSFYLQGYHDHYVVRLSFPELAITHTLRLTEMLHHATLSPDGKKLAVRVGEPEKERLRLYNAETLQPIEWKK